ncbi:alpha/beta hydrolase [Leifsonia poae]|uniref:alpha/beta hydrolase n=1 Tax=Leifsonia poae TaxID=110933 RepID=UPI003D67F6AD
MQPEPVTAERRRDVVSWIGAAVALIGVFICGWALLTGWGAIVHGHPAYAIWLGVTLLVSLAAFWLTLTPRRRRGGWRRVGRVALIVGASGWLALTAWLRPYTAVEPALAAMHSDSAVTVTETPTEIVMHPRKAADGTGLLFQPGALVDPRAYAAVLRPVSEAGHTVVIAKQPLGIAFLATGALESARSGHPEVKEWVVGGHSLGGTVAAMEADAGKAGDSAPVAGLLLYASYPASDISSSLKTPVESISGSRDGLATPDKIQASRSDLPGDTVFTVIQGGVHSQFGDYGPQSGDNTPTISHDDARKQISSASVDFFTTLAR